MSLKSKITVIVCLTLMTLCAISPFLKRQKIYLVGDSTMANKKPEHFPETGWGQVFNAYFTDNVEITNLAANGASTKTFITQKRWQKLMDLLAEGDYVFIEFGHNDEKLENKLTGTTLDEYEENLKKFVREVKDRNAIPILMTPLMRRSVKNGKFYNSHKSYPDVVRKVAESEKVVFIDMLEESKVLLEKTGIGESKKLFLMGAPGELVNYPKGVKDNTHFNEEGAHEMARLAIEGIKNLKLPLAAYIK